MARPKGSKNKKTLEKEKLLPTQIRQLEAARDALAEERTATEAAISEQQAKLRDIRRRIRKLETQIGKLKEKAVAAGEAAKRESAKAELQAEVGRMIAEGVTAEEILERIK